VDQLLKILATLTKHTNKITKLLKDYEKARTRPADNAYILEKKMNDIEKYVQEKEYGAVIPELQEWINREKADIDAFKEEFRIAFGQALNTLFQKDGKKIRGQYPVIRVGLYTLKIDFQFGSVALYYGPEIEKIRSGIRLHAETVYGIVKQCDDELHARQLEAADTYEILHNVYKRRLALHGLGFGAKIPIMDVLSGFVLARQSKKFMIDPQSNNFKGISRIALSYLMFALKKTDIFQQNIRLHVATFNETVDKKNALWIPDNEDGEGTHYSHISFIKGSD
jgi:hypothetical protein